MPNISKLTLPNNETYNLKDLRLDNYGTCSTAAGTVAKTVTVNNSSFALVEGVIVTIKFTTTNTAANPTLNVNSTSAKPIYYKGAAIQAGLLQANKIYTLIYNGTQYQIIGDIDQNASVQSDWNENDSTSQAYIQNRTHYKTSIGYILPVDLIEYTRYLDASEITCEIDGIEHTYNYLSDYNMERSLPEQYGEWNFPNGGTDADLDLTVQTAELVVDGVAQNLSLGIMHDGDDSVRVYYNSEYLIGYENKTLWYLANNNTQKQSIILRLPMANECFEYTQKLDSNYLNGSLIESGTGYKSEIFNGTDNKEAVGYFSHIEGYSNEGIGLTIRLTGDANTTTYEFTETDRSANALWYDATRSFWILYNENYEKVESKIVNLDLTGTDGESHTGTITFDVTLDSQNALSGAFYSIDVPMIAGDFASHAEGAHTYALSYGSHAEGEIATASGQASHAEGHATIASGQNSHAEGYATIASEQNSHAEGNMSKASGYYSHAEGFMSKASDSESHAEGYRTTASGIASHAEGSGTTASGDSSHAEGSYTTASGDSSHAEGGGMPGTSTTRITLTGEANATTYTVSRLLINGVSALGVLRYIVGLWIGDSKVINQASDANTGAITSITVDKTLSATAITNSNYTLLRGVNRADGRNSHVEGTFNHASGDMAHAEGIYNVASGLQSHAEGYRTTASGTNSHVEGRYTIAQRASNHVFGNYNLPDTGGTGVGTKGNYIEIVGNGTADATRSNARTLDWSGNEVLAGKLTVGAGPVNNMDVATKQYVDENAGGDATIAISNNVITLTNASGQTSSITLPVYSGAVSGGTS